MDTGSAGTRGNRDIDPACKVLIFPCGDGVCDDFSKQDQFTALLSLDSNSQDQIER